MNIKAPELTHAILELANVLAMAISADAAKFALAHEQPTTPAPQQTTTPVGTAQPAAAAVPTAAPPTAAPPAAPATPPAAPATVPTTAPTYTLDQLAVAATQLMDAGKRDELVQLLQSFGVQALTMLPKEQYGAFATKLRELGARL
ncbi:MAG: hypothetical protein K6T81_09500 [Alicyclobacillus macrosporangiidus]|uniref:hypothetical protein n=1 Tax=Alicyclobacillus macrosporangiidus TaxID=392015 RepID=UPI0026F1D673|nr:hypothetical protein [Alicyclobacillus macrosporangiidus]MCL6598965.1 hypothetical protein [Alicyclobacillus macrosporangiidus]